MATTPRTGSAHRVATPWGAATPVEQAVIAQRAGEKRFATVVELLETERGETLVRVAYSTGGSVRRGPVTLRARDLERLRTALADRPRLGKVFDLGGGA
jgi:hypothetical protein